MKKLAKFGKKLVKNWHTFIVIDLFLCQFFKRKKRNFFDSILTMRCQTIDSILPIFNLFLMYRKIYNNIK